jgi:type III restriction enzyme
MSQVVIENPVINSPFFEPQRHFKFDDDGITDEIVDTRRKSSYFTPIPQPKKRNQPQLPFEWTKEREEENWLINQIRVEVKQWRLRDYPYITRVSRKLLDYWINPERERKLFFCQIEALETAIYITEVAGKDNANWIENQLVESNKEANPDLFRMAFKMATGSGKTVVMAMLIAWQALNKIANPQDRRFGDAFVLVAPGITIRDRLRVLLPNDPQNYYVQRDILPLEDVQTLCQEKIIITNFHAFQLRETIKAGALTKSILNPNGDASPFTETPDQMVNRVCRELGNKKNIIVINDEAHHCYRRKASEESEKLKGDERKEAEKRDEEARIWISGIEAINRKIGVKVVYDLSATPFFLRGSGYREGALFPWVVSDFSLIDAIECGIVKIPRVPVADDSATGDLPTYRDLWFRIRDELPKKKQKPSDIGDPKLPVELEGALKSLYSNYEQYYHQWEQQRQQSNHNHAFQTMTPPVMIVVCNNTMVSKMVYDWIAGYTKALPDGREVIVPGQLEIFRNENDNYWLHRPNTILVDSEQLESGAGMNDDFKAVAAYEIEHFKDEYRQRYPDRSIDQITDEDLLREVMNTVGKPGKLGEHVKCVVSVSMLTEGWDANTVTHILGVRAFGTQLLCEQVVGRGLRRISYEPDENGMFEPEYAEIYGVPFSFIPTSRSTKSPGPSRKPTRVRALEERTYAEITFPRVIGYRYDIRDGDLQWEFTPETHLTLSTQDVPTMTESSSVFGESVIHTLNLDNIRVQQVAFKLSRILMQTYFSDGEGGVKHWYFPQLLSISRRWIEECVHYKDGTFPEMLWMDEFAYDASERIYRAIVGHSADQTTLKPILNPYSVMGSTSEVNFDTIRPVYQTSPEKCHVNYVALDSEDWEAKMVETLEHMDEVRFYVKNDRLGLNIPYAFDGKEKNYIPDFIAQIETADGIVNLLIEVTGERRKSKVVKVDTAKTLWIPAVNNHGGFGKWDFIEITDPWNAQNTIRSYMGSGWI